MPSALAWLCGSTVDILNLPAAGAPSIAQATRDPVLSTFPPNQVAAFAVNPTRTAMDVCYQNGATEAFRLPQGTREGSAVGELGTGKNTRMMWLPRAPGASFVAAANQYGISLFFSAAVDSGTLWAIPLDVQFMQSLPGGRGLVVISKSSAGGPIPSWSLEYLDTEGHYGTIEQGRLGYMVGMTGDVAFFWREEGVQPAVFTAQPPNPGPGPFSLRAIPVPQQVPEHHIPMPYITALQMVTSKNGWAVTDPEQDGYDAIIQTMDGGLTWLPGTPAAESVSAMIPLDGSAVAAAAPGFCGLQPCTLGWTFAGGNLVETADRGLSWTPMPASVLSVSRWRATPVLSFANAHDGWALLQPCFCASGKDLVYSTNDGGHTWIRDAAIPIGGYALTGPAGGVPETITMMADGTGWITGPAIEAAWVMSTANGGGTWAAQRLRLPPAYRDASVTEGPVVASSGADLTMPVQMAAPGMPPAAVLYKSTDGGQAWKATRPVPDTMGPALVFLPPQDTNTPPAPTGGVAPFENEHPNIAAPNPWFVLNARDAWVVDGTTVYATTDGGDTWTAEGGLPAGSGFLAGLSFVSAQVGFLAETVPTVVPDASKYLPPVRNYPNPYRTILLKTSDGGKSWTRIEPNLVCRNNC